MKNLVENFFRHEYGHLVAVLTQKVGLSHIHDVEDAVQNALIKALETWAQNGTPDKPHAWLYKVANNNILGILRQNNTRSEILKKNQDITDSITKEEIETVLTSEFKEGILKWLFICCHPSIAIDSQIVFALKTLCGFSIKEISIRLFITETNAYKRYSRARTYLKNHSNNLPQLKQNDHCLRLPAVNKVLYLIFTEGYLSSHLQYSIRSEMCEEAIRLSSILVDSPMGKTPETFALLALMHLHISRLPARVNNANELLLLEQQDRSLWDQSHIQHGLYWLSQASVGGEFSRYHAEAGIAIEHCLAASFEQTNWDKIIKCYELLEKTTPSALHQLNKVVAIAQLQGAEAGLTELYKQKLPEWLLESYQFHAVISDLNRRCGKQTKADISAQRAINLAPTPAIKKSLETRLKS